MRRLLTFIAILTLNFNLLYAQFESAGTTAFSYLNIKNDARSTAMAGASVALPNGLYGVFTNASALAFDIEHIEVFLGYNYLMDGIWGVPIAFSRPYKYGTFAINIVSTSSGKIAVRDVNNQQTGENAQWSFLTGGVSWGYKLSQKISIGASVKGVHEKVDVYSSNGIAIDLCVQYRTNNDRLISGFVVKNAGIMVNSFSADSKRENLPLTFEGGISFVPRNTPQLRLALDINKSTNDYVNFEPALEINVYKKFLAVRLGYAFSQKDAMNLVHIFQGDEDPDYVKSNISSLCVGSGLKTNIADQDLKIDFGMQFHSFGISPSYVISAIVDFK